MAETFVHVQDGSTPILMAAQGGHVEALQILMDAGVTVDATMKVRLHLQLVAIKVTKCRNMPTFSNWHLH